MKKKPATTGELALINQIRRDSEARAPGRVRLGIGDDCAVLRAWPGQETLVTTDLCLEGRHFRRDWHTPQSVGHRCLTRGLSDLAAMGATPIAAFLSLAMPAHVNRAWLNGFFRGLRALADEVQVPLAGGDTAQSPSDLIIADIVLVGSAPAGKALRRSTVRAGDLLYVTGSLGGSAAELLSLKAKAGRAKSAGVRGLHPQMFPAPRVKVGAALLRRKLATACMDVSDGLSTDLKHVCVASNVSAEIELDRLPIHLLAAGRLDLALHGGEDYELLFAAGAKTRVPREIAGVPITRIGRFVPRTNGPVMVTIDKAGKRTPLEAGGWEHFIA